jgi:biotin operon repressor
MEGNVNDTRQSDNFPDHRSRHQRAGPSGKPSRISRRQVIDMARRHFEGGELQVELARELGISASYMARLIENLRKSGHIKVIVNDGTHPSAQDAQEVLHIGDSQLVLTVDGSVVTVAADTYAIKPIEQSVTIGHVRVTVKVERLSR